MLFLFDGSSAGIITDSVSIDVRFPTGKLMTIDFLVTKLDPSVSAVFGHHWLTQYNPMIDWRKGHISFDPLDRESLLATEEVPEQASDFTPVDRVFSDSPSDPDAASASPSEAKPSRNSAALRDIRTIGAAAFRMVSKMRGVTTGMLSFKSSECATGRSASYKPASETGENIPAEYHDFLDVFSSQKAFRLPEHRSYDLKIDFTEDSPLPTGPIYPMSEAEHEALRQYIQENLAKGHINSASSPGGAPVFYAVKPDGSLRLCVDYRGLNRITKKDRYPIPLISGQLDQLRHAKIYTKLDLRVGYSNVRIAAGDEWKTAFRTRYGTYEYRVIPFGLTNAPAAFQRFMNDIFSDLLDVYVIVYLDDILIYSDDPAKHKDQVREVLRRLRANDLFCKPEKCEFHASTIEYLGFVITPEGISMDVKKVKTILDWPEPRKVKEIQSFLGFANFYRRFVFGFSDIIVPLTRLTRKLAKWNFNDSCQEAFETLKKAFTSAPILHHYDPSLRQVVETDASDYAIAAIFSVITSDNEIHPVAFHSRSLTAPELNYDTHDKELLAIFEAFTIWRHYLEGSQFQIDVVTDHKNLEYFSTTKVLTRRQVRWSEYLSTFDLMIRFRPGKLGAKPDALTRRADVYPKGGDSDFASANPQNFRPIFSQKQLSCSIRASYYEETFLRASELMDYESLRADILSALPIDQLASDIIGKLETPAPPKNWSRSDTGFLMFADKIYVPDVSDLRLRVLKIKHDHPLSGHPGKHKTATLTLREFFWPKLRDTVSDYCKSCVFCSRNKTRRHKPYGILQPLPISERPWHSISVDFIEQLPSSDGFTAILVIVDRLTKQAIFIPTTDTVTSEEVARLFLIHVFSKHGTPSHVSSDRGSEFISHFFRSLGKVLNIALHYTSGHHPEANGQAEITNQTLEQFLRFYVNYQQTNWSSLLPLAEFAYNNAPHSSTGISPFFANKGYDPAITIHPERDLASIRARDFAVDLNELHEILKSQITIARDRYSTSANRRRIPPPDFKIGQDVFLSSEYIRTTRPARKLSEKYLGPFPIIAKVSEQSFTIKLPDYLRTVHPVFHVSQLEPHFPSDIPNRSEPPPDPVEVDGEIEYEIAEILDSRYDRRLKRCPLKYYVRWAGYEGTAEEFDWLQATNLKHSSEVVETFHILHPDKPGNYSEFSAYILNS
jgi:hypothetical protein